MYHYHNHIRFDLTNPEDTRIPDGTYQYDNGQLVEVSMTHGYQVAEAGGIEASDKDTAVRQIPETFGLADKYIIGFWTDKDGTVCVDKSYWIPEFAPAVKLGQAWEQKSIWNWAEDTEEKI
jgi:hypothetical protein